MDQMHRMSQMTLCKIHVRLSRPNGWPDAAAPPVQSLEPIERSTAHLACCCCPPDHARELNAAVFESGALFNQSSPRVGRAGMSHALGKREPCIPKTGQSVVERGYLSFAMNDACTLL
eukprot:scaffold343_cov23-Tisochrysis_lutea.AAC.1